MSRQRETSSRRRHATAGASKGPPSRTVWIAPSSSNAVGPHLYICMPIRSSFSPLLSTVSLFVMPPLPAPPFRRSRSLNDRTLSVTITAAQGPRHLPLSLCRQLPWCMMDMPPKTLHTFHSGTQIHYPTINQVSISDVNIPFGIYSNRAHQAHTSRIPIARLCLVCRWNAPHANVKDSYR